MRIKLEVLRDSRFYVPNVFKRSKGNNTKKKHKSKSSSNQRNTVLDKIFATNIEQC